MKKILWGSGAAIVLSLIAWVVFATAKMTDISNSLSCSGNLCAIGSLLHHYHETYGHFPPAYQVDASGKPAHSWRVLLMLWEKPELFAKYKLDEPWNSPNNRQLENLMPRMFQCPSDRDSRNPWHTNYFVVVGNETLFPGPKSLSLRDLEKPSASTVMLVEATGLGIHWMEPRDLDYETLSFKVNDPKNPSLSAKHDLPNFALADVTRSQYRNRSPGQFREMMRIKAPSKPE